MPSLASSKRTRVLSRMIEEQSADDSRRDALRHWLLVQLALSAMAWGLVATILSFAA
jgi:hypothetical protein